MTGDAMASVYRDVANVARAVKFTTAPIESLLG